ncbi:MAG: disulfide bond formation protein B [Bdellovibrionota bacterium]
MRPHLLKINFLFVLIGVIGSLYFSEILKYPPCILCWYQRICFYPLLIIFGVALWNGNLSYRDFAFDCGIS